MQLTPENAAREASRLIGTLEDYPGGFEGCGIVTCAGGIKYNTCAWVLIKLLRRLGCDLPIEAWYLGDREGDRQWMELVRPLGVTCVDAHEVRRRHPRRRLKGWPLKPYAIQHSRFRDVLFLDADNVPVRDPSFLFNRPEYQQTGTVFWPDPEKFKTVPDSPLWSIFGLPYRPSPDQESGQLLVDKERAWKALNLCNWYNEHSDFYYQHVYGDKETFRFAWQRLEQPIVWIPTFASEQVRFTLCQHDFAGEVLFQHRFYHKWSLYQDNPRLPGFVHEDLCLAFLEELREVWSPLDHLLRNVSSAEREQMRELSERRFLFDSVGQSRHAMTLSPGGEVAEGLSRRARFWWLERGMLMLAGSDGRLTCRFRPRGDCWEGRSRQDRKRLLRLSPLREVADVGNSGSEAERRLVGAGG